MQKLLGQESRHRQKMTTAPLAVRHPSPACLPPPLPCRWDNLYEATDLADLPHRRLTKPCKVLEHFFDGERRGKTRCGAGGGRWLSRARERWRALVAGCSACGRHCDLAGTESSLPHFLTVPRPSPPCLPPTESRESLLKLEVVAEGTLNAVAFWFDLHLDDTETLTNGEAHAAATAAHTATGGQQQPGL